MANSFFTGTDAELLTGSESFSTQISATPTAFGLTAAMATSYAALNTAFASAYMVAQDPLTRTKGTVAAKRDARIALKASASNLAKIIDGTPTVTNQQKEDLGLNVRKTPGPRPAPGPCTNFKVQLFANGSIELTWKCTGATGTVYQVWRKIGTGGGALEGFEYLGGTGTKKYVDATIPLGSSQVTYQIQAVRSTAAGPFAQFNVNFGVSSAGAFTTASISDDQAPKLAA